MPIIDFFVNLLKDPRGFIASWIVTLGPVMVYSPLFLIVFVETGVVFFPFLPGDSLLFAVGVFSAEGGGLNLFASLFVFYAAAILGNTSNYWIARFLGKRIIDSGKVKSLTPERMAKLDNFFERFGGLTIVITRFMPFFRTFAPFVAGTGHMNFAKFTLFNCIGGVAWVSLFVLTGYFFGGVPFVQEHFEVIVLGIVAVSVLPAVIGVIKGALNSKNKKENKEPVLTVEQMRKLDDYYINNVSSGIELMGKAGKALADEIDTYKKIAILCGSGNNGGDGYAATYHLINNSDAQNEKIDIFYIKPPRSEDSKYYADKVKDDRVSVNKFDASVDLHDYDCIVDCLLGTGFSGKPSGDVALAIKKINECKDTIVVSMDINSGVNGDTGEGELFVKSELTLSIGYKKRAFLNSDYSKIAHHVKNVNIGYVLRQDNLAPFDKNEDIIWI